MEERTPEQRLTILEQKLNELERLSGIEGKIDVTLLISALMTRTDRFIDDVAEVRRGQARVLDLVITGQREAASKRAELTRRLDSVEAGFEKLLEIQTGYKVAIGQLAGQVGDLQEKMGEVKEQVSDLKEGQQVLQAGQEQIITLLTGRSPRND